MSVEEYLMELIRARSRRIENLEARVEYLERELRGIAMYSSDDVYSRIAAAALGQTRDELRGHGDGTSDKEAVDEVDE